VANWDIAKKPLFGLGLLASQVMIAAHRPDIPSLQNQDPSGVFGDPAAPRLRFAVLGDSTVTAPGVDPLDASWSRQLAFRFAAQWHVELHSLAVGGSKACDVLTDQVPRAIALQPDVAFVSVGGNDVLRSTPLARFEREYSEILDILQRHVPHIAVSGIGDLGSIPRLPAVTRSVARIRARSFDRAVRRAAHRHPGVLKTNTWSSGWDEFNTNPETVFAADLFHASAYGHGIYTAAAMTAAEQIIASLAEGVPQDGRDFTPAVVPRRERRESSR
jgi:lysophospholipase L1-like esterase